VPITPTYPGVYIEELPSTVHTIIGVSTSVTAFIGFTKRGPADTATQIFSFGDFERTFGGLDPDSPLTYAVNQFFLNGGSEAWVVRVAQGASKATVNLADVNGNDVLDLAAASSGSWANSLRVTVDYGTTNPDSLFNLTATSYALSGGVLVPDKTETFLNLSFDPSSPSYAIDVVNYGSTLITAKAGAGLAAATTPGFGTSTSAELGTAPAIPANSGLAISLDGEPPVELVLAAASGATPIKNAIVNALPGTGLDSLGVSVSGASPHQRIVLTSPTNSPSSSVEVVPATANDAAPLIGLGVANGGTEVDAIAPFNPLPTGTVGAPLTQSLGATGLPGALDASASDLQIRVTVTANGTATGPFSVTLLPQGSAFATKQDLRAGLQSALQAAASGQAAITAELAATQVALVADRLVVSVGGRADSSIAIANAGADHSATTIGFGTSSGITTNVAAYTPSIPGAVLAQLVGTTGADGTAPTSGTPYIGDELAGTGIFALAHVDLFNLLVLPDKVATDTSAVMSAAMTYCEQRRAFLIVDLPTTVDTLQKAQTWIADSATPKSANAAAYFPRLQIPDPMQGYRAVPMASAGTLAGLYARIDASRGVWKAPAGTEATLRGPTGVAVPLNDPEQGTLNPLGLNVTRALPVYGNVAWGARTLDGADQLASQWKYIPVRRLALYIEESLFRGTKWAVFEPNDEPLWAQLRLSVGSFMHDLFRQHAFEGASPRQAYLVKCDGETTTQSDIDQGIVNILVGFAPLKPAEFVVIQITQLAGQLDV
jgi:phage tail sheath protein FI